VLDAATQHCNSSEQRGNNFRDGEVAVFGDPFIHDPIIRDSIIHDHRALQQHGAAVHYDASILHYSTLIQEEDSIAASTRAGQTRPFFLFNLRFI
jgi:hypothetical protein